MLVAEILAVYFMWPELCGSFGIGFYGYVALGCSVDAL